MPQSLNTFFMVHTQHVKTWIFYQQTTTAQRLIRDGRWRFIPTTYSIFPCVNQYLKTSTTKKTFLLISMKSETCYRIRKVTFRIPRQNGIVYIHFAKLKILLFVERSADLPNRIIFSWDYNWYIRLRPTHLDYYSCIFSKIPV